MEDTIILPFFLQVLKSLPGPALLMILWRQPLPPSVLGNHQQPAPGSRHFCRRSDHQGYFRFDRAGWFNTFFTAFGVRLRPRLISPITDTTPSEVAVIQLTMVGTSDQPGIIQAVVVGLGL